MTTEERILMLERRIAELESGRNAVTAPFRVLDDQGRPVLEVESLRHDPLPHETGPVRETNLRMFDQGGEESFVVRVIGDRPMLHLREGVTIDGEGVLNLAGRGPLGLTDVELDARIPRLLVEGCWLTNRAGEGTPALAV